MRSFYVLIIFLAFPLLALAQKTEQTGWLVFVNNTKFNKHWGMYLDLQLRSADDFEYARNTMIRPGVNYYINKRSITTVGYLLNNTYTRLIGTADNTLTEHRIWEQFTYNQPIKATILTHRFRLEQRFIERTPANVFSQRLRYMARAVVPLAKQDSSFIKGLFLGLQDELFLNLQNKDKINGNVFDQNRAYAAVGYRFSKKVDIEAGYLNQAVKGKTINTSNNVVQFIVYTRF